MSTPVPHWVDLLCHEMRHIVIGKMLGYDPVEVKIVPGGTSYVRHALPENDHRARALIAAVGCIEQLATPDAPLTDDVLTALAAAEKAGMSRFVLISELHALVCSPRYRELYDESMGQMLVALGECGAQPGGRPVLQ